MILKGKKLLVIGGAGLIGSHTTDLLLKEDVSKVIIYDNFVRGSSYNLENSLSDPRVEIFNAGGDITQSDILTEAIKGCDGVFHFAALWLLQCHEYPRSAFKVNIEGTFNVLEACRVAGVERLVYSSSASVYGDALSDIITEEHPFNNKNFYGATKIAGEAMLHSYHHRYGIDYIGLRYMNVYGPRQDYRGAYIAVIMKMLDAIDNGESPVIVGDGSECFDFVAVEDCAQANICAMKASVTDENYNVGTGKGTSLKHLAESLVKLTGSKKPIKYVKRNQNTLVKNRIGCPKKAERDLNFVAKIDLENGLERLIKWRREHIAKTRDLNAGRGII
ncbi:NAD-dependent epimerase/dehydratase family protein [bacterium]|nr:NAD-dependent epimerase/dehydratase family protein [bacterium]